MYKIKEKTNYCLLSFLIVFFVLATTLISKAQTIPVGMTAVDELLRDLQLQGKISLDHSLTTRPFFTSKKIRADSLFQLIDSTYNFSSTIFTNNKNTWVEALPFAANFRYNSHSPYGNNQNGFMDAKGLQTFMSGGIFAKWGLLSLQLKPEFVYAANPNFELGNGYGAATKPNYSRTFLGQSSIRVSAGGISLGLSNENLWWGPGIQNSLLMSNNAPGFNHLVLNTTKPLKTPIGNFELSIIAGKLIEDTSVLLEVKDLTTFYYAQG
ncbi:MAG: capsule assembly Wzi family protein, partial [Sediminibacterium sp.]